MYDKAVRRRRAVLAVLLALSLTLLTAYFGESSTGSLHGVQRGAMEVLAPIQEGANRVVKPFRDLFGWFGDTLEGQGRARQAQEGARRPAHRGHDAAGRRRREQAAARAAGHQHRRRHEGLPAGDRARLRPLAEHLVLDGRDQQGLERRRQARPARGQRRGPRRQGQVGLRRQRDRDAAHRPGVRRLRQGGPLAASRARSTPRSAPPATCCSSSSRTASTSRRASTSSPRARSRRGCSRSSRPAS